MFNSSCSKINGARCQKDTFFLTYFFRKAVKHIVELQLITAARCKLFLCSLFNSTTLSEIDTAKFFKVCNKPLFMILHTGMDLKLTSIFLLKVCKG